MFRVAHERWANLGLSALYGRQKGKEHQKEQACVAISFIQILHHSRKFRCKMASIMNARVVFSNPTYYGSNLEIRRGRREGGELTILSLSSTSCGNFSVCRRAARDVDGIKLRGRSRGKGGWVVCHSQILPRPHQIHLQGGEGTRSI